MRSCLAHRPLPSINLSSAAKASVFSPASQSQIAIHCTNGVSGFIVMQSMEVIQVRPAHRHQRSAVVQVHIHVPVIIVVSMNSVSHRMDRILQSPHRMVSFVSSTTTRWSSSVLPDPTLVGFYASVGVLIANMLLLAAKMILLQSIHSSRSEWWHVDRAIGLGSRSWHLIHSPRSHRGTLMTSPTMKINMSCKAITIANVIVLHLYVIAQWVQQDIDLDQLVKIRNCVCGTSPKMCWDRIIVFVWVRSIPPRNSNTIANHKINSPNQFKWMVIVLAPCRQR